MAPVSDHPARHQRTEVAYTPAELAGSLGIARSVIDDGVRSGKLEGRKGIGGSLTFTQPAIGRWLDTLALDLEVAMLGGPMQIARAWLEAGAAVRQRVRPAAVATAMGTLAQACCYWDDGLGIDGNPWDQKPLEMPGGEG